MHSGGHVKEGGVAFGYRFTTVMRIVMLPDF